MKYAAIAAILLSGPAWSAAVDADKSHMIVQTGEVISFRPFVQSTLGVELLIPHDSVIYICQVGQDTRFGYNGAPSADFVVVNGCVPPDPD
ncbi:hypothetical protein [Sulfitobacter sp.]|uniref:hypothetical protein n=1 Tax=Sulfitobacter sp. TaxID=1903071 RepID=UPI004058B9D3